MTPEQIEAHFRGETGFRFARWSRPIVPMVLGVEQRTLGVVKGAIEALVTLAGHQMAETDPEMGANLYVFFLRDWSELADVPEFADLIPELPAALPRLRAAGANQYRLFRFENDGAIRAAFSFLRMDQALMALPADVLALGEAVKLMLLWGGGAFDTRPPLETVQGEPLLRPEIAALIRAAYAPELPASGDDPALALRLFARMGR